MKKWLDPLVGSRQNCGTSVEEEAGSFTLLFDLIFYANPLNIDPYSYRQMLDAAWTLESQMQGLAAFGKLTQHPWRGFQNIEITELEEARLVSLLQDWNRSVRAVQDDVRRIEGRIGSILPGAQHGVELLCRNLLGHFNALWLFKAPFVVIIEAVRVSALELNIPVTNRATAEAMATHLNGHRADCTNTWVIGGPVEAASVVDEDDMSVYRNLGDAPPACGADDIAARTTSAHRYHLPPG